MVIHHHLQVQPEMCRYPSQVRLDFVVSFAVIHVLSVPKFVHYGRFSSGKPVSVYLDLYIRGLEL